MSDDGSIDADPAPPFERTSSATERSRVLTEAENQAINEKIDRLIAMIQAGRPLRFSPDPDTGNIDISAAYDKSASDDGRSNVEADIAASPENFGNVIRTSAGRRRILSPTSILSDSTEASKIIRNFSSSEWEGALTPIQNRAAFDDIPKDQIPPPVLKRGTGDVRGITKRDSKYVTYWDRNDVKVAPIAPIPLNFNRPLPISTPSIHSAGSDLDCISPLFDKSFEGFIRETSRDLRRSENTSQVSSSSGTRDRISDWLERVEPPSIAEERTDATGKRQAFKVFQDKLLNRDTKPLTASKALKDVSNLRRPGYLQHNSFAQTSHKNPSPQKSTLQDPNRTAHFDLALARLEDRAPPQQHSPIKRYADHTGVYDADVLVESRRLRPRQPVPVRLLPLRLGTVQRLEKVVAEREGDTTN